MRHLGIGLAAAAGCGAACLVFHPGVMSPDSIGMYGEAAVSGISGAGQSPALALLWMGILKVWPTPLALLLFQNIVFWSGLALVSLACERGTAGSAMAVLFVGLFPPVFALLGILWKDVLFAAWLTCAAGLTLLAAHRSAPGLLIAAVAMLGLAMCTRVNAFPAVLPLAGWIAAIAYTQSGRMVNVRSVAVTATLLTTVLFIGARAVERAIVPPGSGAYLNGVKESMLHDLAGMALTTGDLRMPEFVRRGAPMMSLGSLRQIYDTADANPFFYNGPWPNSALITHNAADFVELIDVWGRAVAAHPGAYLRHRAEVLSSIFQVRGVYYPFHTGIDPNDLGLTFPERPLYRRVTTWLYDTRVVFFRGWLFAVIAALLVVFGVSRRRWATVAVCSSGLLYASSYAVITSGSDFRYIWWLVVATLIGLAMLRARPARTPLGDGLPG